MNVAQKATHFMKLEHSQRFSKWRNLENNANQSQTKVDERGKNITKSITTEDILTTSNSKIVATATTPLEPNPESRQKSSNGEIDDSEKLEEAEVIKGLSSGQEGNLEPSRLSLRDRVHMFNKFSSVSGIVHVNPAAALLCQSGLIPSKVLRTSGSSNSLAHNYQEVPDIETNYDNFTSFPLFRNHSTNDFSTITAQHTPIDSSNPIPMVRNNRIKSMFIPHTVDNDGLSEDGEVSSGGMEVAEIISKSYENSPLARKKPWKSPNIQQSFLSRETWRKYGSSGLDDNITNWSTATELPEVIGVSRKETNFIKVSSAPISVTRSIKTSTSNLLPILTALSSSDDQINDLPNPTRIPSKSRSVNCIMNPPPPSRKKLSRKQLLLGLDKISSSDTLPNSPTENFHTVLPDAEIKNEKNYDVIDDFSAIERQGDPLVMKKDIRILRRKSSGSKYKNPLKALAARMEFSSSKSPSNPN